MVISRKWLTVVHLAVLSFLIYLQLLLNQPLGIARITSIGDTLWRAIDWHRSGGRGRKQKTAAIEQGIKDGYLSNSFPFILDQPWITRCRATVRWEVIGEEEDQWVEEEEEEEAEETRGDLRTPREPDHPPSWIEFPNFPRVPSDPPPGATSPRIVIAKAKTSSGAVPTLAKPTVSRRLASESSQVNPRPSAKRSQPATEPVSEVASASSGSRIVSISKSSPVPPRFSAQEFGKRVIFVIIISKGGTIIGTSVLVARVES